MSHRRTMCGILAVLVGCVDAPLEVRSSTIANGTLDAPVEYFPGVVRVGIGPTGICSGTIIATSSASAWVLTAAHCFISHKDPFPAYVDPSIVRVTIGADSAAGSSFTARAIYLDPQAVADRLDLPETFDAWPTAYAHDFALLRIDGVDASLAASSISTASAAAELLRVGTTATIAGYGRVTNTAGTLGLRRRGTVTVDRIGRGLRGFDYVVADQRAGSAICPGDSGGPLLVRSASGALAIGGVASVISGTGPWACNYFGVWGRADQGLSSLIAPVLSGQPSSPAACIPCAYAASAPGGACAAEASASRAPREQFLSCSSGRNTQASCRAQNPEGASAYDAYWSCLTTRACVGLCSGAEQTRLACRYTLDGAGPCDSCLQTSCCQVMERCRLNSACAACTDALDTDPAPCAQSALYAEVRACLDTSCRAACGGYLTAFAPPGADSGVTEEDAGPDAGFAPDAEGAPDLGAAGPDAGARDSGSSADAGVAQAAEPGGCSGMGPRPAWQTVLAPLLGLLWLRRRASKL